MAAIIEMDTISTEKHKLEDNDEPEQYRHVDKKLSIESKCTSNLCPVDINETANKENCQEILQVSKEGELNHDITEVPTRLEVSNKAEGKEELFNGVEISKLTKTQMKKYMRVLKWQEIKKDKRAKEKLKSKNKKIEAKRNNIDLGPTRKQLKKSKMANSSCKIGVIIDLSFDDLMINKDMGKVIKQILRIYTENRRSKAPMQVHLTNFNGKSKEEMKKHNGYENWDMNFHSEDYLAVFPKDKLVYLSSESNNVIQELEQDKIYIIGGLVDHNSHKGICYKKAVEQGIAHGKLPITEYFDVKTRKVFTINQVFEILLRVSEGETFKDAFEAALPRRINMVPTTTTTTNAPLNNTSNEVSK